MAPDRPIIRVPLVICVLESPFLLMRVDDSATKHYYNDDNIGKIAYSLLHRLFCAILLSRNALQFIVTSHYRHRANGPLLHRHCTIT